MSTETHTRGNPIASTHLADVQHGVHVRCQEHRPTVRTICGLEMGWDEEQPPNVESFCVVCRDIARCPICGLDVRNLLP